LWKTDSEGLHTSLPDNKDFTGKSEGNGRQILRFDATCRLAPRDFSGPAKAEAAGEVSLQVANLRQSGVDYRKFYVDTGTGQLQLKAETKYATHTIPATLRWHPKGQNMFELCQDQNLGCLVCFQLSLLWTESISGNYSVLHSTVCIQVIGGGLHNWTSC
jgi:hypothetical protein